MDIALAFRKGNPIVRPCPIRSKTPFPFQANPLPNWPGMRSRKGPGKRYVCLVVMRGIGESVVIENNPLLLC